MVKNDRRYNVKKEIRKIFFIILPTLIIVFSLTTVTNVYVNFAFVSLFNFIIVLSIFYDLKMIMKKIRGLQAKKSIKVLLYAAVTTVAILAYLIVFLCLIWCFTGALYTNGIIFINSRILK